MPTSLTGLMPMPDKVFIDSNVVVYAIGQASTKAHQAAPLFVGKPTISTQVLSETANVASRRGKIGRYPLFTPPRPRFTTFIQPAAGKNS